MWFRRLIACVKTTKHYRGMPNIPIFLASA